MTDRRTLGGEVRAATDEDGRHIVTLHAIRPDVVDDYGSVWRADTFDQALAQRLPTLCWSHDWSDPIGYGLDHTTGPDGPTVRFQLDDFDAVPRARQAYAQTKSGTIRDCSVGFSNVVRRDPTAEERSAHPGVREIIEQATMDELSLVLSGAVPGAKVLAVRMAGPGDVPREQVAGLMARLATGELTLTAALTQLEALNTDDTDEQDEPEEPVPDAELEAEVDALLAESAAVLDQIG